MILLYSRIVGSMGKVIRMPTAVPENNTDGLVEPHAKLVDQQLEAWCDELTHELDMTKSTNQMEVLNWLEGAPELVPDGFVAADVALEYLLVSKGLTAAEVTPRIKCAPGVNTARRMHWAVESHQRRDAARRDEERRRVLKQQSQLMFSSQALAG